MRSRRGGGGGGRPGGGNRGLPQGQAAVVAGDPFVAEYLEPGRGQPARNRLEQGPVLEHAPGQGDGRDPLFGGQAPGQPGNRTRQPAMEAGGDPGVGDAAPKISQQGFPHGRRIQFQQVLARCDGKGVARIILALHGERQGLQLDRRLALVADRLARDVDRLGVEAQISELDAGAPEIEIFTNQPLVFKKNRAFSVPLRVTDDYRVEKVVVHARNESDDGYLQIPLSPVGEGLYNFIITPDLHGNQDVYFFVVARDHSGNIGRLGGQDDPRKVERKRWFRKSSK